MPLPISPVQIPQAPEPVRPTPKSGSGHEFQSMLNGAIEQVERSSKHAADSIQQFLSGESDELHNTVLATQKAEMQLELFLQVRNKVVSAYQEIMKMQV
jgi:flagellar hook-basal body complex protein FliE